MGKSCPAGRHWESLFLSSAYAVSCGERDRAEGCVKLSHVFMTTLMEDESILLQNKAVHPQTTFIT